METTPPPPGLRGRCTASGTWEATPGALCPVGLNSGGGWGRWQPLPQASHAHSLRPCHVRKALASELGLGTSEGKGCFPVSRERPPVSVGAGGSGVCGSLSCGGRPADRKPPAQGRLGNDRNEPPKGRGSRRSWRKVPQGPDRNHCPLSSAWRPSSLPPPGPGPRPLEDKASCLRVVVAPASLVPSLG